MRLRHRLIGAALDRANGALARIARLRPDRALLGRRVALTIDVPYGRRPGQRLDVLRPARQRGTRPAALYLHGGGFRVLSKDTHGIMAGQLAAAGWVVFCADYRLAPRHPFPAGLEDAADALCWVLDHAAEHDADASSLTLVGESAGGNLCVALALATCFERPEPFARALFARDPRITTLAPLCAFLDVAGRQPTARERALPPWIRARVDQLVRDYAGHVTGDAAFFANPLAVLESDLAPARPLPPVFASCGERDPILEDTRRLERALARRGVEHDVRYYAGQGHAFQAKYFTDAGRRSWEDLTRFARARADAAMSALSHEL